MKITVLKQPNQFQSSQDRPVNAAACLIVVVPRGGRRGRGGKEKGGGGLVYSLREEEEGQLYTGLTSPASCTYTTCKQF